MALPVNYGVENPDGIIKANVAHLRAQGLDDQRIRLDLRLTPSQCEAVGISMPTPVVVEVSPYATRFPDEKAINKARRVIAQAMRRKEYLSANEISRRAGKGSSWITTACKGGRPWALELKAEADELATFADLEYWRDKGNAIPNNVKPRLHSHRRKAS
jgi:hypothetical protein